MEFDYEGEDDTESLLPSYEMVTAEDIAEAASISSQDSQDTNFLDLADLDVDPTVLHSTIQTLDGILKATVSSIISLQNNGDELEDDITRRVTEECQMLSDNIDELSRCTYTADNGSWTVDPTVYKWASDCVVLVLALQADVERLLEQYSQMATDVSDASSWAETMVSSTDDGAPEEVITLHRYLEPLQRFKSQIAEYLPFFKA